MNRKKWILLALIVLLLLLISDKSQISTLRKQAALALNQIELKWR
ncbi:hypothetical protein J2T12_002079 [Paenibacillus anaericanus]|nr:hypothetical protein [Paenibacillus anaericanus]MDQ0088669.1 hypothetical protein [Paenibacillus anaericanus]